MKMTNSSGRADLRRFTFAISWNMRILGGRSMGMSELFLHPKSVCIWRRKQNGTKGMEA